MKRQVKKHFDNMLHHIYINPLEKCNLRCKMCYTKKTSNILSEKQILDFIFRYKKEVEVKVVTFCGGEVMTLAYFPHLVNTLTEKGIFIQIITNGTIDKLKEINSPNLIKLIISLDGPESYHDLNRGKGMFQKSIALLKKARQIGFHTELFSIVTKQNLPLIPQFETYSKQFGTIDITYHPRKPHSYLSIHPISNIIGDIVGFDFLSDEEIKKLSKTKNIFPPKNLGCYQIALASNGNIYGCCEGFDKLGIMNDSIPYLIDNLKKRIKGPCMGCSQTDFMCGLKNVYKQE